MRRRKTQAQVQLTVVMAQVVDATEIGQSPDAAGDEFAHRQHAVLVGVEFCEHGLDDLFGLLRMNLDGQARGRLALLVVHAVDGFELVDVEDAVPTRRSASTSSACFMQGPDRPAASGDCQPRAIVRSVPVEIVQVEERLNVKVVHVVLRTSACQLKLRHSMRLPGPGWGKESEPRTSCAMCSSA